jgi:hypothetical protein
MIRNLDKFAADRHSWKRALVTYRCFVIGNLISIKVDGFRPINGSKYGCGKNSRYLLEHADLL